MVLLWKNIVCQPERNGDAICKSPLQADVLKMSYRSPGITSTVFHEIFIVSTGKSTKKSQQYTNAKAICKL